MVVPVPMNQVESMRLQSPDHVFRLGFGDIWEEVVELDADLLDWNLCREAAFQHFILETFNINFQEVDGMVPIDLHLTGKTGAG